MLAHRGFAVFYLIKDWSQDGENGKTGLQSGSEDPDCRLIALFGCDLAILPGNPADLASNLHGLPAVEGAGHVLTRCAWCDGGDAAIAGAVARADVDLAAGRFDRCLWCLSAWKVGL